ncbi:MAG TPA: hypothetical protein RMH99_00380 [Sandaracinaceae bacterium LLY-WYZ-13_1]|nr:hypothetical protein [Sandaracinaceae bacterium LLY-WYZ-13_1]
MRVATIVFTLVLVGTGAAHAQYVDLTEPSPAASRLTEVRRSLQTERREAGVALLVGGLASVVGGALTASIGHEDPFWLSFGVGTAGWGAVNAALSISMLDVGDGGFAAIEADRMLRGEELAEARERAIRDQHRSATLFALNFGLDVAYIASAVLLFFVADQLEGEDEPALLRGYAAAQAGQGTFLLVFDLIEWIASNERADRLADVSP